MKKLITATLLSLSLSSFNTMAHNGGATSDPAGINPHFTAVVDVTCFDDGNGTPAKVFVRIKDSSDPIPGLLLSLTVYKGNKAISTTDTFSGDTQFSEGVELYGGAGRYTLIVTQTDAGPRLFTAEWHCETIDGIHTGTDEIVVRQFQ